MLTESPRVIFCGESPLTNCNWCMGRRKIVRGVGLRWQTGVFLLGIVGVGVPDDPVMRSITKKRQPGACRGTSRTPSPTRISFGYSGVIKEKGASPQRRPNTIIIPHCQTTVNYLYAKSCGFSVLHQSFGSYLCCFPSCKNPCPVVD